MALGIIVIIILLIIIFFMFLSHKGKSEDHFHLIHNKLEGMQIEFNKKFQVILNNQFELYNMLTSNPPVDTATQKAKETKQAADLNENKILLDVEKEVKLVSKESVRDVENSVPIQVVDLEKSQVIYNIEGKVFEKETIVQNELQNSTPRSKTDFEKIIGENLLNKIGIGILLLGVIFFIKVAIDNNWIGEAGRIIITIVGGLALIGLGHWIRKNYHAFSSVLVGGGLAMLYFAISFGFQEYQLFNQTLAFLFLVLITGFAVLLSINHGRQEIAIVAILGGFLTPLLVSSGKGNYLVLFTYTLILDIGMLVLSYYKRWRVINIITFVFTVALYLLWFIFELDKTRTIPYPGAFIFATLFYAVFYAMNVFDNLVKNAKFEIHEFIILIANTILYYIIGIIIIARFEPQMRSIFTFALALFNFGVLTYIYKKDFIDKRLKDILITNTIAFVSLVAPMLLEGGAVCIFWSVEIAILWWLNSKIKNYVLQFNTLLLVIVNIISLIDNWDGYTMETIYQHIHSAFISTIFWSGIASILSLATGIYFAMKIENFFIKIPSFIIQRVLTALLIIVSYFTFLFEIVQHFAIYIQNYQLADIVIGAYNYFCILLFIVWTRIYQPKMFSNFSPILAFIATIAYFFHYQLLFLEHRDYALTLNPQHCNSVYVHWINMVFLALSLFYGASVLKRLLGETNLTYRISIWYVSFVGLFILSSELDFSFVLLNIDKVLVHFGNPDFPGYYSNYVEDIVYTSHKIGFPVLWGIASFLLMILGMNLKNRDFRLISISIFAVTIIKLFAIDVWDMTPGGRVIAFILLGIILLIVSFMYQRLKRIILKQDVNT